MHIVKVLNTTELYTLKWLILCHVNFTSLKISYEEEKNNFETYTCTQTFWWIVIKCSPHYRLTLCKDIYFLTTKHWIWLNTFNFSHSTEWWIIYHYCLIHVFLIITDLVSFYVLILSGHCVFPLFQKYFVDYFLCL